MSTSQHRWPVGSLQTVEEVEKKHEENVWLDCLAPLSALGITGALAIPHLWRILIFSTASTEACCAQSEPGRKTTAGKTPEIPGSLSSRSVKLPPSIEVPRMEAFSITILPITDIDNLVRDQEKSLQLTERNVAAG